MVLGIHLLVTLARLLRPGGARAVAAESLILNHQGHASSRSMGAIEKYELVAQIAKF